MYLNSIDFGSIFPELGTLASNSVNKFSPVNPNAPGKFWWLKNTFSCAKGGGFHVMTLRTTPLICHCDCTTTLFTPHPLVIFPCAVALMWYSKCYGTHALNLAKVRWQVRIHCYTYTRTTIDMVLQPYKHDKLAELVERFETPPSPPAATEYTIHWVSCTSHWLFAHWPGISRSM